MEQRPIQFRAWVFGSGKNRMIQWKKIDALEWCNDKLWYSNGKSVLLGNLILLQFSGYHDKKGNEIYEGDIVKRGEGIASVGWVDGHIDFCNQKNWVDEWNWCDDANKMIVIGNIYENPDMIEIYGQKN